jgi:hypothetical protein
VLLKNEGACFRCRKSWEQLPSSAQMQRGRNHLSDYSYASYDRDPAGRQPRAAPLLESTGSRPDHEQAIKQIPTVLQAVRERVSPETPVLYAKGCDNGMGTTALGLPRQ